MQSAPLPLVSIILVAWNSGAHLLACLSALSRQTFQTFEVIVVDNGSTDNSIHDLEGRWTDFHLIVERLTSNLGFAVANNIGAKMARGEWIALLNADAYPEPNWLENLIAAAEGNPQFNFFSSRQLQADTPELLDGAGDTYHASGLAWRRHYNRPAHQYELQPEEVFGACAAAALYRREDFLTVGGFDETYFAYFEDVDLSFRLRLAGGRCLYVPQATVHHVGSASTGKTSDFAYYHVHRNMVWTFIKDMPALLLWWFLPLHLFVNVYLALSFLIKEKRVIALEAKWDAFRGLSPMLRARKSVQSTRKAGWRDLYRVMEKDLFAPRRASHTRIQKQS
jgi:GT2 family glycosyltransferase